MRFIELFQSRKTREKEAKKRHRKAFRDAGHAVESVKDRIKLLKETRDDDWREARNYLKDGNKTAAQRALQSVRANELMVNQLEKKRWVFEQLLTKLELSKTDQEFSLALNAINTVVKIDPESVADVMDEVEGKLGDQVDIDRLWGKMHDAEMVGIETDLVEEVPSVENMMKELEDEVVADVRGDRVADVIEDGFRDAGIEAEVGEGRKRLRDLLEGEK